MSSFMAILFLAIDGENSGQLQENAMRLSQLCLRQTMGFTNRNAYDVCQWNGVECHNGVIWKVKVVMQDNMVASLDWLPSSLRKVFFKSQWNPKLLITRRLPRTLEFCWMVICAIQGTVDLQTIPSPLRVLNLNVNRISGTVILTRLPGKIEYISLCENQVIKAIVNNENLPESLVEAYFYNREREVKIVTFDKSPVDDRVRFTMSFESPKYVKHYEGW